MYANANANASQEYANNCIENLCTLRIHLICKECLHIYVWIMYMFAVFYILIYTYSICALQFLFSFTHQPNLRVRFALLQFNQHIVNIENCLFAFHSYVKLRQILDNKTEM